MLDILDSTIVKNLHAKDPHSKVFVVDSKYSVIGENAFDYFRDVEEIIFHGSIEEIESAAFSNCCKLKNIKLPKNLRTLGHAAFSGCSSLTGIEIPESVRILSPWTFGDCCNLNEIIIPYSIQHIDYKVFENSNNINKITFSNGERNSLNKKYIIENDCLINDSEKSILKCFSEKEKLEIPEGIKKIERKAFAGRKKLKSISLPSTLNSMEIPFAGCDILTSIEFPNGNDRFEAKDNCLYDKKKFVLHRVFTEEKDFFVPKYIKEIRASSFPVSICAFACDRTLEKINQSASENPVLKKTVEVLRGKIQLRKDGEKRICDISCNIDLVEKDYAVFEIVNNGDLLFSNKVYLTSKIAKDCIHSMEQVLSSREKSYGFEFCEKEKKVEDSDYTVLLGMFNSSKSFEEMVNNLKDETKGKHLLQIQIVEFVENGFTEVIRIVDKEKFIRDCYYTFIKVFPDVRSNLIECIFEMNDLTSYYERIEGN